MKSGRRRWIAVQASTAIFERYDKWSGRMRRRRNVTPRSRRPELVTFLETPVRGTHEARRKHDVGNGVRRCQPVGSWAPVQVTPRRAGRGFSRTPPPGRYHACAYLPIARAVQSAKKKSSPRFPLPAREAHARFTRPPNPRCDLPARRRLDRRFGAPRARYEPIGRCHRGGAARPASSLTARDDRASLTLHFAPQKDGAVGDDAFAGD